MGVNSTKGAGIEAISDDVGGIAETLAHFSAHAASLVQSRFDCLSQSWPGGQQSA